MSNEQLEIKILTVHCPLLIANWFPRTRRCHHTITGTPRTVGQRKLYGKGINFRLVAENADTAAMYEAMKPEMWFSSHWFLVQRPALA